MIGPYKTAFPRIAPNAVVFRNATVLGAVTIGPEASIWPGAVLRGDVNTIVIGARTNVQDNATVHVTTARFPTTIGDEVTIGHNAVVHGATVGNRVLVGMGAGLLDGCRIGNEVLIAAGSLVRGGTIVPDGVLVAGNPAVVKRPLSAEERLSLAGSAATYVECSRNYLTFALHLLYSPQELSGGDEQRQGYNGV